MEKDSRTEYAYATDWSHSNAMSIIDDNKILLGVRALSTMAQVRL